MFPQLQMYTGFCVINVYVRHSLIFTSNSVFSKFSLLSFPHIYVLKHSQSVILFGLTFFNEPSVCSYPKPLFQGNKN